MANQPNNNSDIQFVSDIQVEFPYYLTLAQEAHREITAFLYGLTNDLEKVSGYRPLFYLRPGKSAQRCVQKALELREKDGSLSAGDALSQIGDLAGARILVVGLRDLNTAHKLACQQARGSNQLSVLEEDFQDHVDKPKKSGFRGYVQGTKVTLPDGKTCLFELQFLTYLQHAWDQLQHETYESARSTSRPVPERAQNLFVALSAELHLVDKSMDHARTETLVTDQIGGGPTASTLGASGPTPGWEP